jgi:hypothetical protein
MQQRAEGSDSFRPHTVERPALRRLPLGEVARMSGRGEVEGWHVAERGNKWTLGLQARGEHYLVMLGAEAMTFDSMKVAVKYLRALTVPTGVENPAASRVNLTSAFSDAIARIEGRGAGSSGLAGRAEHTPVF